MEKKNKLAALRRMVFCAFLCFFFSSPAVDFVQRLRFFFAFLLLPSAVGIVESSRLSAL